MNRRLPAAPPPAYHPGGMLRFVLLLGMLGIVVFAMIKLSDPRSWRWISGGAEPEPEGDGGRQPVTLQALREWEAGRVGRERSWMAPTALSLPALVPAGFDGPGLMGRGLFLLEEFRFEHGRTVDLDELFPPPRRQAPIPRMELLRQIDEHDLDRQPMFFENKKAADQAAALRHRADAAARYHLLRLAHDADPGHLAADATGSIRHSRLLARPGEHRGELIHVRGDLLWVKHLELQGELDGLEHAYMGLVDVPATRQQYAVIFTRLPDGFPAESRWAQLFLRDVELDGYFLKVLQAQSGAGRSETVDLPLLVSRSVQIPAGASGEGWAFLQWGAWIAAGILVLGTLGWWFYRRSERGHEARLRELRQRIHSGAQLAAGEAGPAAAAGPAQGGEGVELFDHPAEPPKPDA